MAYIIREIGSEFYYKEENPTSTSKIWGNKIDSIEFYLSGRSALSGIIKDICIDNRPNSVYMPSFCCDSMIKPFLESNIKVMFYDVIVENNGFKCIFESKIDCDIIFIIDYFGYQNINKHLFNNKIIIKDCTHSLLRNQELLTDCDYAFASLRKWTAMDIGFAIKKRGSFLVKPLPFTNTRYINYRVQAREAKLKYFDNNCCGDKIFLELFEKAENELEQNYQNQSSNINKNLLFNSNKLDVNKIRKIRRENASYLTKKIKELEDNRLRLITPNVEENDCPLFVCICVAKDIRPYLKQHFINNKIYAPIHWPLTQYHSSISKVAKELYDNELSLICDQRYNLQDINREFEVLKSFFSN